MKSILIITLSLVFSILSVTILYFSTAFCCWELNWVPLVSGFLRFIFAFISFIAIASSIGFALYVTDKLYN